MQYLKHQLLRSQTVQRAVWRLKRYRHRELNFYFLSTGHCGTKFLSRVLDTATNAVVFHQPQPYLRETMVKVVEHYAADKNSFESLSIHDFPELKDKLSVQATIPTPIYGDTLNQMFPYGHMLYRHFGPDKLRLVHLIRNPASCCRSILKVEREEGGTAFRPRSPIFLQGQTSAEKAAHVWNNINTMIQYQFDLINDPTVCKTIRLEDVTLESLKELFGFLHLEGFDEVKVAELMQDKSSTVRHSHIDAHPEVRDVSEEELQIISHITASIGKQYGYDKQV